MFLVLRFGQTVLPISYTNFYVVVIKQKKKEKSKKNPPLGQIYIKPQNKRKKVYRESAENVLADQKFKRNV